MDELSHSPYSGQCILLLIFNHLSFKTLYLFTKSFNIDMLYAYSIDLYSGIHIHGLIFPVVFDVI